MKGGITLYKIGEFSQIVGISVRTLRYYDEENVLKPSEIDPFTGYRYYTDDDIIECELIKLLKSLDFTLEEIAIYKNNITDDIMQKKEEQILKKLNEFEEKYQKIKEMRKQMQGKKIILKRKYEG